jgi:hypothetical protein
MIYLGKLKMIGEDWRARKEVNHSVLTLNNSILRARRVEIHIMLQIELKQQSMCWWV